MRWNENLAGPALQIAQTTNTSVCVTAGPGTGKTYALMRRLARLLEEDQVTPDRILLCTFTRTAAGDLAREVQGLGIAGADGVYAYTVHALCFSMLSRHEVFEVTRRHSRPLLKCEERFLLEDLRHGGLGGVRETGKKMKAFSAAWARLQHETPGWATSPEDQQFQGALQSWLRFHEAMLIGELVPEGLKYLRNNPQSPYRSAFDHVLVDEFQDLNCAEQQLVELLSSGSLVVIGDEDQSIYSFKHAHPEGIQQFPQSHPATERVELAQCRRCPNRIVAMANALISNNTLRTTRALEPFPGNPDGEVFSVQWPDMQAEANGIARFIKSRIDSGGIQPGKVLVLAPRREFGYLVRDQLQALGVAAHSFFSEELLDGDPKEDEDCAAQSALALLILLANSEDKTALRCWCGFGHASLQAKGWAGIRQHSEQNSLAPWLVLEQLEAGSLTLRSTDGTLDRFKKLKTELTRLRALNGSGLFDAIFPTDQDWAKPFSELKIRLENPEYSAGDIVDVIRRNVTQPELPINVDYVRVMSLHKSKGVC